MATDGPIITQEQIDACLGSVPTPDLKKELKFRNMMTLSTGLRNFSKSVMPVVPIASICVSFVLEKTANLKFSTTSIMIIAVSGEIIFCAIPFIVSKSIAKLADRQR